ncbi:uncharacterized protein YMR258C homologue, putative [Candida dubliniensis CD36]|uniref:Uncharacterized protein YMR258C homologue, putative n=1 Tax=Candida dubliniensis (strain CD36 / ATCC MYA-646 / CBS 7987 / NCPF 3949 / NRRL Y-17841) TaxID=573826 RepID=B9WJY3_CANDC|nr:uncharacterized protein YMR258C homologue, putative [Candida dubliniensis CD36]CAX40941.1 uncharacterized protein YMR258C homologue, putative [Candida dubliniensis CD36]
MGLSLIELPISIKNSIIKYLPQQALINLSLTNFEFYQPCLQQLYKNITIQCNPPLRPNEKDREKDFQDSTRTVIYGFSNPDGKVVSKELNLKMIYARLVVLRQSLTINQELIGYIKQIHILGEMSDFNESIIEELQNLVDLLDDLDVFYIGDYNIRQHVDLTQLKLRSIVVDKLPVTFSNNIEELLIGENTHLNNFHQFVPNLTSLILPNNTEKYWAWIIENVFPLNNQVLQLTKFKLVFSLDMALNSKLMRLINWRKITQLELILAYTPGNDDDDYVIDCFNMLPATPNLKKLSIVQGDTYSTHRENELFDLNVFNFLTNLLAICDLKYLSIKHNIPNIGNLEDGSEGNYYRRSEMFMQTLPKIINSHNIVLILPNLFQSFAGYEQYMNTVLFNGCKCKHCQIYLGDLDEFMMYHKYYDASANAKRYKDMNASHLLSEIGQQLNYRMVQDELLTQLNHLSFPLVNVLWDFHTNTNNKVFKCYDIQTIDQGEYDEVDYEPEPNSPKTCRFNKVRYQGIPKSVGHYVNQTIEKIVNLNRGNAESVDISNVLKDGGDLGFKLNMKKLIINGFNYIIDRETNGTHFYQNVYD